MSVACAVLIIIGGGSARADFTFAEPVNLGPPINTEYDDGSPFVSADGLSLYFTRNQLAALGITSFGTLTFG